MEIGGIWREREEGDSRLAAQPGTVSGAGHTACICMMCSCSSLGRAWEPASPPESSPGEQEYGARLRLLSCSPPLACHETYSNGQEDTIHRDADITYEGAYLRFTGIFTALTWL